MTRRALSLLACVAAVSCGDTTEPGDAYTGDFSGQFTETTVSNGNTGGGNITCMNSFNLAGTITMHLVVTGSAVSGTADVTGTETETGKSGDPTCPLKGNRTIGAGPKIAATTVTSVQFADTASSGTTFATKNIAQFTGALANDVVTGQFTWKRIGAGTSGNNVSVQSNASATMAVTLHK